MVDTQIIDGKKIAQDFLAKIKAQVDLMPVKPKLAVVVVGDFLPSQVYVKNKQIAAQKVGIESAVFRFAGDACESAVLELIVALNNDVTVNGILLQLPVPAHMNADRLLNAILPQKDVDGLHFENVAKLVCGKMDGMVPCTPLGCLYLMKTVCPDLTGKHVVIVGRSALVGRPLATLLASHDCTVTQAHSKTKNLAQLCVNADIIVSAVGKPALIRAEHIKLGAIVIDVGINRSIDGKIVGDVLFLEADTRASFITPVPGGVGPMTIAMLLFNTLKASGKDKTGDLMQLRSY